MDSEKEKHASFDQGGSVENVERNFSRASTDINTTKLSAVFENPLQNVPRDQLMSDVEKFCKEFDLIEHLDIFQKGALVAQNPSAVQSMNDLTDEDKNFLEREKTHKWSQPWQLYFLCSQSTFYMRSSFTL
jgi:hypothetical protein